MPQLSPSQSFPVAGGDALDQLHREAQSSGRQSFRHLTASPSATSWGFDADALAASQANAGLAADLDLAAVAMDDGGAPGSAVGTACEAVGPALAAVGKQR